MIWVVTNSVVITELDRIVRIDWLEWLAEIGIMANPSLPNPRKRSGSKP